MFSYSDMGGLGTAVTTLLRGHTPSGSLTVPHAFVVAGTLSTDGRRLTGLYNLNPSNKLALLAYDLQQRTWLLNSTHSAINVQGFVRSPPPPPPPPPRTPVTAAVCVAQWPIRSLRLPRGASVRARQ